MAARKKRATARPTRAKTSASTRPKPSAPTRAKTGVKSGTKASAKAGAKKRVTTPPVAKQKASPVTRTVRRAAPPAAAPPVASADTPPAPTRAARRSPFDPSKLDRTVIALPLVEQFREQAGAAPRGRTKGIVATAAAAHKHAVVIDLNLDFREGREKARLQVIDDIVAIVKDGPHFSDDERNAYRARLTRLSPLQYVAAKLTEDEIIRVVRRDVDQADNEWSRRRIYRVWPDFEVSACLTKSTMTVKADAARIAFNARGRDIVWAVMDSGVDGAHPHFKTHKNLELREPIKHDTFVDEDDSDPLVDDFGHGTHVAGIIAGCMLATAPVPAAPATTRKKAKDAGPLKVYSAHGVREEESEERKVEIKEVREIAGVAPECKIVSMKVLDSSGNGTTTAIIRALQRVNEINQQGRRLLIHGVNLSLGYDFDPEWFACGQSPLCVEVDRLVRSGVVVVVAAGNSGYGFQQTSFTGVKAAGLSLTINDPGNADGAITVGSTHREMPHLYGASFFSSKGPTGDGRNKPDLLAPGEKIVSCAAGQKKEAMLGQPRSVSSPAAVKAEQVQYIEDSGTSMAAPHVSGAIAAFLSVRREFQGQPERVKRLFLDNATDLNRDRYFQGRGLVDLMRTIQSV
jgi:serine protease AprX